MPLAPRSLRRALPFAFAVAFAAGPACQSSAPAGPASSKVTLRNTQLPVDARGKPLLTGEASVLSYGGAYYFYFNDWGSCPGVDCCPSAGGCASCCFSPPSPEYPDTCVYAGGHQVVVYRTTDLVTFSYEGVALPLSDRKAGILFRPHVVYHAPSGRFLMWYEDRYAGQKGYAVAESETPEGPFHAVVDSVVMHGGGRTGDFDLFVDEDGTAYQVRTGLVVEKLAADFRSGTGEVGTYDSADLEAPVLFKRQGTYFLLAGDGCCACRGGSNLLVFTAKHPLGPYTAQGDIGSVSDSLMSEFAIHDADRFITRAQGSDVFTVPAPDGSSSYVWLGNQWVTASEPGHPRDHDLLYWALLSFDASGNLQKLSREDETTLTVADR